MPKLKPQLLLIALATILISSGFVFAVKKILTVSAVNKTASLAEFSPLIPTSSAQADIPTEQIQKLQIKNFKNGAKSIEQDIKVLKKQLSALARRKVAIPSFSPEGISNNLTKLKTLIKQIKAMQSWGELNVLKREMSEPMRQLSIDSHQVEVLARWPDALKLLNQELNRLVREVKRAKPIIERLFKKEADLTDAYREFDADVNKIKLTLAEANTKISAGDLEAAFSIIEIDFFDQIDNVEQNYRSIIIISNLGRFASYLKQNITTSQNEIKSLKKKGIDASELQDLLSHIKTNGNDVLALIKAKPIDEDAILSGIQEMDELKQDFSDKVSEVTDGEEMSWGKDGSFFSKTELSSKAVEAISWLQKQVNWTASVPVTSMDVPSSETTLTAPQSGNQSTSTPSSATPATPATPAVSSSVSAAPASPAVPATPAQPALTADTTVPSTPTNLTANSSSSVQINLAWTASTDNVGVTGYRIYRGGVQMGTSNTTNYSDTGLSSLTTYSYTVAAYDAAGNVSPQSTSASATTQALDTTPPVISSVSVSLTSDSATITWTTNESSDSQASYGLTSSYGNTTPLNSSPVVWHSVSLSNLTGGTTFHYKVISTDGSGNKTESGDATFTTTSSVLPAPSFLTKWGSRGSDNGQFNSPFGIAVDASGNVYVVDSHNHRIQKFTSNGVFTTKWGSSGSGDGQFSYPFSIAVNASGNIYVTDDNKHIQKFTNDGTFILKWGSYGSGNEQFSSPEAIAVDAGGNVYVVDRPNNRVQKFTGDGTFITKWGSSGSGDGQFQDPRGIAIDGSGNVYVVDSSNSRVQKFTSDGAFITKWGSSGSGDGQFFTPFNIAVDASGNVYVADGYNNRVQKFTSNGVFITKWGSSGSGDGQFSLPRGIAIDGSGNAYVTEADNSRVQKFAP